MYLRPHELIYLFATEWLLLGLFGLLAVGLCTCVGIAAAKSRWRIPRDAVARVGFAVVVAIALFFGTMAWITTFKHSSPSLRPWLGLLIAMVLGSALAAARGWWTAELVAISALARSLSFFGLASLLSLPFTMGIGGGSALVAAANASAANVRPAQTTLVTRPNIVLITIDTLSAAHLTPSGYSRPTSPQIGNFAAKSTVFEQFHSNSNFTTAGIGSILTGVSPWTHRVLQITGKLQSMLIRESVPARLKEAGYLTAYFGSNPWAGGRFEGFSEYFDKKDSDLDWTFGPCFDRLADVVPYLCAAASNRLISYSYSAVEHAVAAVGLIRLEPHSDVSAMVDRVSQWTESVHSSPAPKFLWVHLFPPHDPYAAPHPWLGMFDPSIDASDAVNSHPAVHFEAKFESQRRIDLLNARYDESIAYVDHYVGQMIASIRRQFGPNTVIILTADHGESFGHGYGSHGGVMLWEDLIHVPLIVSIPGVEPARRKELASQIDIAPTIASLAGISPSPSWSGRSLLGAQADDPSVFSMNFEENVTTAPLQTGVVATLHANWKYVKFLGNPRYPNKPVLRNQLFDLAKDPGELSDVSLAHPDIAAALAAQIDRQLELHGGATGG